MGLSCVYLEVLIYLVIFRKKNIESDMKLSISFLAQLFIFLKALTTKIGGNVYVVLLLVRVTL